MTVMSIFYKTQNSICENASLSKTLLISINIQQIKCFSLHISYINETEMLMAITYQFQRKIVGHVFEKRQFKVKLFNIFSIFTCILYISTSFYRIFKLLVI